MPIEITIRMVADNALAMNEQLKTLVQGGFIAPQAVANAVDTPDAPTQNAASAVHVPAPTSTRRSRGRPKGSGLHAPATNGTASGSAVPTPAAAKNTSDDDDDADDLNEIEEVIAEETTKDRVRDVVDRITKAFKTGETETRAKIVAWREGVGLALVKDLTPEHLPAADALLKELGA